MSHIVHCWHSPPCSILSLRLYGILLNCCNRPYKWKEQTLRTPNRCPDKWIRSLGPASAGARLSVLGLSSRPVRGPASYRRRKLEVESRLASTYSCRGLGQTPCSWWFAAPLRWEHPSPRPSRWKTWTDERCLLCGSTGDTADHFPLVHPGPCRRVDRFQRSFHLSDPEQHLEKGQKNPNCGWTGFSFSSN